MSIPPTQDREGERSLGVKRKTRAGRNGKERGRRGIVEWKKKKLTQPTLAKLDFSLLKLICLPISSASLSIFSPLNSPNSENSLDKGWMCNFDDVGFPDSSPSLVANLFNNAGVKFG